MCETIQRLVALFYQESHTQGDTQPRAPSRPRVPAAAAPQRPVRAAIPASIAAAVA
eukprot:SAG11_NODE_20575_length_442_cov_4.157434_1_plen_55_part_10